MQSKKFFAHRTIVFINLDKISTGFHPAIILACTISLQFKSISRNIRRDRREIIWNCGILIGKRDTERHTSIRNSAIKVRAPSISYRGIVSICVSEPTMSVLRDVFLSGYSRYMASSRDDHRRVLFFSPIPPWKNTIVRPMSAG